MFQDHYAEINALVIRAQSGDRDATVELMDFYRPLTRAAVRRCIAAEPRLTSRRDDLEAEIFSVFCELIDQYHPSRSFFSSYLSNRIYFSLMQHTRKMFGQNTAGHGIPEVAFAEMPKGWEPECADDPFGRVETITALKQAVALLKPVYQEAVHLSFFEQLTQTEAADQLSITQSAYCKRLKRAMAQLRVILSDDFLG